MIWSSSQEQLCEGMAAVVEARYGMETLLVEVAVTFEEMVRGMDTDLEELHLAPFTEIETQGGQDHSRRQVTVGLYHRINDAHLAREDAKIHSLAAILTAASIGTTLEDYLDEVAQSKARIGAAMPTRSPWRAASSRSSASPSRLLPQMPQQLR
ncbi:unnamed protein product [Urochloa humidicola]